MKCKSCGKKIAYEQEKIGLCFECIYIKEVPIKGPRKICSNCKIELPLSDFYKDKDKKDKHTTLCKECIKQREKINYLKKKEKVPRYYRGRAVRKKKDWIPESGKYYRYREKYRQPNKETIIFKVISAQRKKTDLCVINIKPIRPSNIVVTSWTVPRSELHWTWKYEEITKSDVLKENKKVKN